MRRLSPLLLAVLLPVPAQASEHTVECFGGFSTEKEQALALRVSCGYRLWGIGAAGAGSMGTGGSNGTGGATDTSEPAVAGVHATSLFLFAETAEYAAGSDSGRRLDAGTIGLRYLFRGGTTVEPFIFGMGGFQNPSRPSTFTDDDDSDRDWVAAAGFGVDFELIPPELAHKQAIVPVLRLQIEGVKSGASGVDPYVRAVIGVSFRFEGYGHK